MKLRSIFAVVWAMAGLLVQPALAADASDPDIAAPIQIGVYYWPGWSPNLPDAAYADPWAPLAKYPGRIPLIGRYDNSSPTVMRKQLDEMKQARLSFVVFDCYNNANGSDRLPQSEIAYMAVATNNDPKFALLWANHDNGLTSAQDWDNLVTTWIAKYLLDRRYLRVNGHPVVFVFSPDNLERRAATFHSTPAALLGRAQELAHRFALPDIAFVGGGGPHPDFIHNKANAAGYAALSDYNMGTGDYTMAGTGYERRIAVYRKYWHVYQRDATLPYILPITVGWDRSPWGGSKEDGAMSTPEQFREHLTDAVQILQRGRDPFSRMGVICCWNEFGEGSILEPTVAFGDRHLRVLDQILSNPPRPGN